MTLTASAQIRRLQDDRSLAASVKRYKLAHPEKPKSNVPDIYEVRRAQNAKAKYAKPQPSADEKLLDSIMDALGPDLDADNVLGKIIGLHLGSGDKTPEPSTITL